MALNTDISQLDYNQAVKRCVEASNDALRVNLESSTGMAIELSAADGDNVATLQSSSAPSIALTNGNTGAATQVIAPVDVQGYSKVNLYVQSTTAIAVPPTLTVQFSPADSGTIWVDSAVTRVLSASNGVVVMATPATNMVARRARVLISAALGAAETATAYLVLAT